MQPAKQQEQQLGLTYAASLTSHPNIICVGETVQPEVSSMLPLSPGAPQVGRPITERIEE